LIEDLDDVLAELRRNIWWFIWINEVWIGLREEIAFYIREKVILSLNLFNNKFKINDQIW